MYIFVDTETGGLELYNSLLTVGLVVTTNDFVVQRTEYFKIKHAFYSVTAGAMRVNGIDLATHEDGALTVTEASKRLSAICDEVGIFTLAGWNVLFDLGFLQRWLDVPVLRGIPRTFDMASAWRYVNTAYNLQLRNSLDSACTLLDIKREAPHNALQDVLVTVAVAQRLANTLSCM